MRRKKVHIFQSNSFCLTRLIDAQRLMNYFIANNCAIINNPKKADVNILVTCAFCKDKEDESFAHIYRLKKFRAELIIVGCLPGVAPGRLREEFGVKSLPAKDIDLIDGLFPGFKVKFSDIPESNDTFVNRTDRGFVENHLIPFIREFRLSRAFFSEFMNRQLGRAHRLLKRRGNAGLAKKDVPENIRVSNDFKLLRISSGCLGKCTYCAIRFATGELRSKPLKDCVREFSEDLLRGCRKFMLVGEDVGAYGLDIGSSFPELLSNYEEASNGLPYNLEICSFNAGWIFKYKDKILETARAGKIAWIECVIQSGNERILKLMNRYHDIKAITETLLQIAEADPDLKLHSHFIAGFPSETEEDFQDTLNLINKINFESFRLFSYSDMHGTAASKMPDNVSSDIIAKRIDLAIKSFQKSYTMEYIADRNSYRFVKRINAQDVVDSAS